MIGTCSGNNTMDYQPNNMEAPWMQSISQIISNTQSKTVEKTTPIFNVGKTSQKRLKNPRNGKCSTNTKSTDTISLSKLNHRAYQ